MNTLIIKYKKEPEAVFSSAQEAFNDKTQFYTPELKEHILAVRQSILDQNILLEPETYTWLPETSELQITRKLSSIEEYKAVAENPSTGWGPDGKVFSEQAGWTMTEYVVFDEDGALIGGNVTE